MSRVTSVIDSSECSVQTSVELAKSELAPETVSLRWGYKVWFYTNRTRKSDDLSWILYCQYVNV